MASRWNQQEQGSKRKRTNQGTRGATRTQPAASNPNKNTKSTDTNRNSGRTAAPKPAPKAAPKAAPKQNKPSGVQKVQQKVTYFTNKNKPKQTTQQTSLNRLARQKATAQVLTGKQTPLPPKRATRMGQTLNPMEQLKTDAKLGRENWISRATVPAKPLTAEQQKKKNQQTAKQSGFNARARKQTLSSYDQKLAQGKQFQIQQAKQRFDEAKAKGDSAGMAKAHREAESLRLGSGYSGGAFGNEYITGKLSQDDYNRLNADGQKAMKQARLTRSRAVTEEEIARADRRIEEILNAPGYRNRGRDINTARGMRETAEGRSTMLGATREQREKDAEGLKNATLAGFHLGAGGAGHWLEATDWTIANRNRDQNMAKWLQDADDYEAARSDLEYYDNYVQTFGEPPAGMNRNVLQMRLNNATQAKSQLERMQTDPHSAYYDETVAQRLGMPTDTQSYWEKMIRQGQKEQLASQEGLSPVEKWINDLYISGIQSIPTTAAALIPGGQGGALAGLASAARGLALAGMGASAAGNRMTELQDAGQAFDQAYRNATVAGIIEAGTEMIGVEKLASAAAGKAPQNALRAILEQSLAEGGEEALSYALNTGYNKLADLPGQEWSWKDFASQAAAGAVMGAIHMGAGVMINSLAASGAVSQERAQRNYQAWQASADQARSLLNDAKQWYAMMDQGAVSQEEAKAALSQVSQQINGQAEPVTREWLARQEELLDIEENAIRGAITRQEARDQQSQILDQVTAQNRDSEANRMAAEWDEEERQARAAQNAAVSARTRLDQRLEDWRWRQDEPISVNPVEQAERMTAEALRATDAEMARRDAVAQLQAETPPITYERSGLPPTSFLGAAIDARREARARAEAEAQVRRDQEAARQNRVAAETASNNVPTATQLSSNHVPTATQPPPNNVPTVSQLSSNAETGQQTFVPNAPTQQQNVPVSYQNQQAQQPVSRLESLASTFGESGAASLRTIGGKMVTGQGAFVRDFTDVYNQVLGGRSESQVSRPAGMSDANYFAAVTAAKNDRQTGWDLDILKASKAAGRNVNAGVDWRDQYVRQMDRKTARTVDGLAKALGVKVVFAEEGSILTAGGERANAEITGNVVRIEKGNPNPVRMLIGHELTHRMQDVSPETYRAFRDYAMSVPGSMEALERTLSRYQRAGAFRAQDNARQMAMDEVTADFAGDLLENSEQLQEFIRRNYENRTLLETIRDFFRSIRDVLTGRERAQTDEAVRLLEEAIKGASQRVNGMERMTVADEALELSDVNTLYSIRKEDPPKKTGVAYKVFFAKNGQLYPPMVANPGGEGTPVGVWLNADVGQQAAPSKSGRQQVKAGGKGTQGGSGSLAFRPGWHLGDIPRASQFDRKNPETGKKELFPANFVWAECEYAADVDYQDEAMSYGYTENGKFRHAYAGLPRLPENGYYRYRTNPKPDTVPWIITGAMRVTRILTDAETDAICRENGVEPAARQGGPMTAERMEKELGIKAGDTTEESKRFSLGAPVEETETLVALHNLNETKMGKALDLGGFPMPSIAVTRKDIPHTNFGDISLVMSRDTIDPKKSRKNTVYSADAWTPTFPSIEYEADSKAAKRLRDKYYELYREHGGDVTRPLYDAGAVDAGNELNRWGGEAGLIEHYRDDIGMMKLYLVDTGKTVPEDVTEEHVERMSDGEIQLNNYIVEALGKDFFNDIYEYKKMEIGPARIGTRRNWWAKNEERFNRAYAEFLASTIPNTSVDEALGWLAEEPPGKQLRFAEGIAAYLERGPEKRTTTVNREKTNEAIRKAADSDGYEKWLHGLFDGLEKSSGIYNNKDIFTPNGNRRTFKQTHYPVTLDNIVKAMAGQNGGSTKNVSGFHGIKTLRAGTAKRFRNIKEMHELEGRLQHLTPEEADKISNALSDRMTEIIGAIYDKSSHGSSDNYFMAMDSIGETLVEVADSQNYTIDNIVKTFGKYQYKVDNELAQDIKELLFDVSQMPVNIFEAKPERAVRFDEVLAAVVPSDMDAGLRSRMEDAGMRLIDYERDNEQSRIDAVNSVEGARFSITPKTDADYMAAVESGDMETAQRMVDEAAKAAGYTIKAYHGTPKRFNEFSKYRIGSTTDYGWFGRGFYFTTEKDVADVYAGYLPDSNVIEAYLNVQNPFVFTEYPGGEDMSPGEIMEDVLGTKYGRRGELTEDDKAQRSEDFTEWLAANGYDGVEIWSQIMILESEQAKRTDPVTYDDDGNVIPLSERFNAETGDIRYSIGTEGYDRARLMRENQELKEKLEYWRGQVKKSDRTKADPKEVRKLAKSLRADYSTEMDAGEITQRLQAIYDGIGKDWSYDRAYEEAGKLARDMIEQATVTEDYLYNENEPLRKFFKDTALVVTPEIKRAIPDYNEWRKAQFGKLRLESGDQTNIDQVFQEAAALWPEWFSEEVSTNSLDQLERIAEVMGGIYSRDEVNPFGDDIAGPAGYLTTQIMDSFWDVPSIKKTFADRAEARLGREVTRRLDMKERYENALQKVREQRDRKLREQSQRYLTAKKKRSRQQKERERRAQILRHVRDLRNRLEKGTDKKNVPKDLREIAITLLESVNTASKDMKGTKRTQDFVGLRDRLQEMHAEGQPIVLDKSLFGDSEENIQGWFDTVIKMQDTPIANMNLEQLDIVWKIVRAVEHAITTFNRTLASEKYDQTDNWANGLWKDSEGRRQMKGTGILLDMETPYTFFSQFGESGLAIYRMLRDAQDLEKRREIDIRDKLKEIVTQKQVKAWSEHRHTFDVSWEEATEDGMETRTATLTLTDSQIMDLYLLSKRPQGQGHLLKGGIVQPEIRTGRHKIERGTESIPLTAEKIGEITAKLSQEQVEAAKKIQKLTSYMAQWGNEASLKAFGYEKFTEPNYWMIRTAKEGIHSSVENNRNNPRSVQNLGLAKSTIPNASNAVDLTGIFENFGRHADEMNLYATWLCPMMDANRLYNWTFRDAENRPTTRTIKGMMNRVAGQKATNYWDNLMKDIQNGLKNESDTTIIRYVNKVIGNAKGAAVGANARVIIQQPTAFFRALSVMNPADLAAGAVAAPTKGSGWKKAKQWAGIALRKAEGGFDIAGASGVMGRYFDQQTRLEQIRDTAGKPAGLADAFTWGKLWNAAEWQTARQEKDLEKGSDEYYRRTAEVFTEMIDQTQVVDGVLQRSQIMRSGNDILKQATAFKGEPLMGANMLIRGVLNYRNETNPKKRTAARKALGRSVAAFTVTAVVNALAQAVMDGIRDDDKDRKYREKFFAAFLGTDMEGAKALAASFMDAVKNDEPDTTFAKRLSEAYAERMDDENAKWGEDLREALLTGNLMENLNVLGGIPFASDLFSMMQGYDVTRADADVVADVIKAWQSVFDDKQTKWYSAARLATQAGRMLGIPGQTLIRDATAITRSFAQWRGNVPMMYEIEKAIYNTGSSKNKKLFESIAWAALKDGDLDTFNHIREDLMESGITDGKKLDNAMKKLAEANPDMELSQHIRDLIGVHPTFATEEEEEEAKFGADSLDGAQYAAYSEERANTYRPLEDRLIGTDAFTNMDDEAKDKALKTLWDYADKTALEAHSNGQYVADSTTIKGIREAEAVGISPADYLIIKTAADAAQGTTDADGNTITNSLGIAKMEALDNSGIQLTAEQRTFMLDKIGVGKSVASFNADNLAKEKEKIQAKADAPSTLSILGEGNEGTVQQYTEFLETVVSDYDSNGKEIKGHKKQDKIIQYIKDIPGLSREQRSALYHMKYESDANNPWA